ncbi:MAG TPA: hypothetical protein DCG60_00740 [Tissierella sp.]|nr:hypothetical protein [Tissierella sp.]
MLDTGFWQDWWKFFRKIIAPSVFATLRMVGATVLLGMLFGFGLSILLTMYSPTGLNPKK